MNRQFPQTSALAALVSRTELSVERNRTGVE
jgi:hypothetical protein